MPLAQFVAFHQVPEDAPLAASCRFAVSIALHPQGAVLVCSRFRRVWELPGGLIDAGETSREAAVREFAEETGGVARSPEWLGVVEVQDGSTHLGAVYRCTAENLPDRFANEETVALGFWTPDSTPQPLGHADLVLLNRFGHGV